SRPMRVKLHVNGEVIEDELLMLVFANTREFGNGADISPGSLPDDGIAELRLVKKPPLFPLMKAFIDIYTHRVDSSPYVTNIEATEAIVEQEGTRSEEHTSELQSRENLVCRLVQEKKKNK